MKAILSIFVILLVLLLIISTLGGSIRTNEQFVESVSSSDDKSLYNPSDYKPPISTKTTSEEYKYESLYNPSDYKPPTSLASIKPSAETSSAGTQNIYFIAHPPVNTTSMDSPPSVNPPYTPQNPFVPPQNDPSQVPDTIEGYDNADFFASA